MELIVDGAGAPASRLADFTFTAEEATALHQEVFSCRCRRCSGPGAFTAIFRPTTSSCRRAVRPSSTCPRSSRWRATTTPVRSCGARPAQPDRAPGPLRRAAPARGRRAGTRALSAPPARDPGQRSPMPEVGTPEHRSGGGGGGRRGRDAERGRAGRDKGQRPGGGAATGETGRTAAPSRPGAPPPQSHPRDQPRGYARDAGGPRVAASTGAPSPGGSRHAAPLAAADADRPLMDHRRRRRAADAEFRCA